MSFAVRRLGPADAETMRELNSLFTAAFDDPASYESAPPDEAYLGRVLGDRKTIVLVVQEDEHIVGGLVAYVLDKLEKERSEIYIYDLAVAEDRRRQGIATALIEHVQAFAADLGAWVIYVQADHGDDAAIALYGKLGTREDVMHFDIPPRATR